MVYLDRQETKDTGVKIAVIANQDKMEQKEMEVNLAGEDMLEYKEIEDYLENEETKEQWATVDCLVMWDLKVSFFNFCVMEK